MISMLSGEYRAMVAARKEVRLRRSRERQVRSLRRSSLSTEPYFFAN